MPLSRNTIELIALSSLTALTFCASGGLLLTRLNLVPEAPSDKLLREKEGRKRGQIRLQDKEGYFTLPNRTEGKGRSKERTD